MTSDSKGGSRSSGARGFVFGLVILSLLPCSVAWGAEDPSSATTRTAARELAAQGAEAFEQGDFSLAYDRLTRAFALFPAPTISIMQARCLVKLGRLVEAIDRYEETRRMPVPEDATDAFHGAIRDATSEAEQLRPLIPRIHVQLRGNVVSMRGAVVTLDGRELPSALLDVDCPADPGTHVVTVRLNGQIAYYREVSLVQQQRFLLDIGPDELKIQTQKPPASGGENNTEKASPPPADVAHGARYWWGWGSLGGAVGLGVGSVATGLIALQKKEYLDGICAPGCPFGSQGEIDAFRSYRTVSYVAGGLSIALASAGAYLLLSEPKRSSSMAVGFYGNGVALGAIF